jgi:hypothetical protein
MTDNISAEQLKQLVQRLEADASAQARKRGKSK